MTNNSKKIENVWLVCPRPNPAAQVRLFCFPYSGVGASIFYRWYGHLPPSIELCAVQLPGRETRLSEPPFIAMEVLVAAAAQALLPHLDKAFAFFGHSLGALLSFELARYLLEKHDLRPLHLFVSGHNAPQIPDPEPPMHDLPNPAFLKRLRELNGMSKEILENDELMELILPILRADFTVCETHVFESGRPLDCPLSAFGGLRDGYIDRAGLEAWRVQTRGAFSVRMFPGDHFYLNTDRALLLRALAQELSVYGLDG